MRAAPEYAMAIRNAAALLRVFGPFVPEIEADMRRQLVEAFCPRWGADEAARFADAVIAEAKRINSGKQ